MKNKPTHFIIRYGEINNIKIKCQMDFDIWNRYVTVGKNYYWASSFATVFLFNLNLVIHNQYELFTFFVLSVGVRTIEGCIDIQFRPCGIWMSFHIKMYLYNNIFRVSLDALEVKVKQKTWITSTQNPPLILFSLI